ncbi:larval cuticle protein LCP-30-like isoform X2 [Chrysoperla carnea]|uniref:larval cuticle protein LCP-30-like isoform X2 n=1 Tax=Chrysoperla carnea TaxID=189513 RepID=UPI001D069420|nr:larval cuticle protein LCP-30-like isoform X2 [Chrysoperla carnea]
MMKLTVVLVILAVLSVVYAQNDGRYRPQNDGRYQPTPRPFIYSNLPSIFSNELRPGQYRPDPGRYRPDNTGRYSNNDGKYRPTDDGKYRPDNSGKYSGSDGKYRPDDSGKYSGTYDPYKHQDNGGGQYQGSKDIIEPYRDLQGPNGPSNSGQSNKAPKAPLYNYKISGSSIGQINSEYADGNGLSTLGLPSGLEQGSAAGLYDNRNYRIIVDDKEADTEGNYHYKYETENKIFAEETGKQVGSGDDAGADATGYYKYTGPDNIVYTVNYHAGEEGFEPEAVHIPTPPPIPELILRSLKYQREAGELDNESIFVYLANSN